MLDFAPDPEEKTRLRLPQLSTEPAISMARATANHNRTIDLFDRRYSIKLRPFLGQGNLLVDQRSAKKLSRIKFRYPMRRSSRHSDEVRLRQNHTDIDRSDYAEFLGHCITCVAHGFNTCATVARVSLGSKSLRKRFSGYFHNNFRVSIPDAPKVPNGRRLYQARINIFLDDYFPWASG